MYLIYSALLAAGLLLALPFWLWQMLVHGKYRIGMGERWGSVPARLKPSLQPAIWIHAVSVGEVLAVSGLIEGLRRRFPNHRVVVSTTTDTGQKLAHERFGAENVFYFPLDFAFALRPYFQSLRPELVVLAETEFWPNFLRLAKESGARVAVVNARISDRSWPGYQRFRSLLSRVLRNIDLMLAQSEEDKRRLINIGAAVDCVQVSGNLKFDLGAAQSTPEIVGDLRNAVQQANAGPVLVCGSTTEGEETLLLDAFAKVLVKHPKAVMVLAPRHPERFEDVVQLLQRSGISFWRRSQWKGESLAGGVFLLDTIGELAALYSLADIAFVGGSLVPRGGHNILEPARYGVPIVVGPHMENFRDILQLFQRNDAVRIVTAEELSSALLELCSQDEKREALGRRAAETLDSQTGATQRTLDALQLLLAGARGPGARPRTKQQCLWGDNRMKPLAGLFGLGVRGRNALYGHGVLKSHRLRGPVVSVGNLSVGGSGKTPFVILLGSLLKERGIKFDVLTRGYGRKTKGVLHVEASGSASDFGDEPLLIARQLGIPVVVGEDRYAAGLAAENKFGPQLHLLDDGFQHLALARDFDIVLVTPEDARDRLLPSGRLREPLTSLQRADVVVLMSGASAESFPIEGKPVWRVRRSIEPRNIPERPIVFCGIARPQGFFRQLRAAEINPVAEAVYSDHHSYTERDIAELLDLRKQSEAGGFVTTEKDLINLGPRAVALQPLAVVPVTMKLTDAANVVDTVLRVLAERRPGHEKIALTQ